MLTVALNKYPEDMKDQEIFGIVVKGDLFRFYRVIFTEGYLKDMSLDRLPRRQIKVLRYPPENYLNITSPNDRKEIVKILSYIRHSILEVLK